jgi:RNA polymerase sigma-70 factor (TIGR02960 family)
VNGGDGEFAELTERFRPELLAHCYRILGSIHDAEDQVQETYVRAWRAYSRFEGRSSLRHWMYTIATRTCLTAAGSRSRRPLPSGLGPPTDDHRVAVRQRDPSVPWLQPFPDDPADVVARRASVRLALVAAMQHLSARQRAALTLRDILGFSTAEAAAILDTSVDAVDALVRRARKTLVSAGVTVDDVHEPEDEAVQRVLGQYLDAFTNADSAALSALVRADVEFEMPPTPTWFTGRDAVVGFLRTRVLRPGQWMATPTRANGAPGFVFYSRAADGLYQAYGIQVITLREGRIARITAFNDPTLVASFGEPVSLTAQV